MAAQLALTGRDDKNGTAARGRSSVGAEPNNGRSSMTMRRLAVAALAALSFAAHATDYTDIWWNPAESGWGVNIAQSNTFIFATLFVYGPGNVTAWYAGTLTQDGTGAFTGDLFTTTGTYLGTVPFNPGDFAAIKVGTATFKPTAPDKAVLTYNVGAVAVNKNIQRQTLTPIPLAGTYAGTLAVNDSGCTNPSDNGPANSPVTITITQPVAGALQMTFDVLGIAACTVVSTGAVSQIGALYSFPGAMTCPDGSADALSVSELRATSLGIEGRWTLPRGSDGCHEEARFSGVVPP
jgi:hypothetical protein